MFKRNYAGELFASLIKLPNYALPLIIMVRLHGLVMVVFYAFPSPSFFNHLMFMLTVIKNLRWTVSVWSVSSLVYVDVHSSQLYENALAP